MKKIYLTKEAQIDCSDKYIVVCEKHNTFVGCATKKLAQKTNTKEFCEECR